jgi:transcriptional regulator GlxA family with amidase domain
VATSGTKRLQSASHSHGRKGGFCVIAATALQRHAVGLQLKPVQPLHLDANMNIGILIFDEVEALDFAGPYEVFTTAARLHGRARPAGEAPLFSVLAIARDLNPVRARAGLRVLPDASLGQHPKLDCLVVPGGVVQAPLGQADVLGWITQQAAQVRVLASVCTGVFLLAKAGCIAAGSEVTTHWEDITELRKSFPQLRVREGVRWVEQNRAQGSLVTSAGISAGIDMSLHLVRHLHSAELAQRTARQMEFDWRQNP